MSRSLAAEAFRDFLQAERTKVTTAFQAVEHIQADYQGFYTRFRADHDKTLAALAERLQALPADGRPKTLQTAIDARVPAECEAIEKRIAELDQELPRLQKETDELVTQSQKSLATLRLLNPQLNDREEGLKADLAAVQKQLDDLNGLVHAQASGLGFVLHAIKIHELDQQRYRVVGRMESLSAELAKVRQEWKTKHASAEKQQAELQTMWQQQQARAGQLRQERDDLANEKDALARQRAIAYTLDNLKTRVEPTEPALDEQLRQMMTLNFQTDDLQAALGSIAGVLGIMKGVDEGLKRLGESATAIINEQQRNSAYLAPLNIDLDDAVIAFSQVWDDLEAKAKDEKAFATHPADFVTALKPFLDDRLTNDRIAGYFTALGASLQRATATWKGK